MPTKTNYSSPIQIPGLVSSLINVAKTVGPEALAKTAIKTGAKGLIKGAIKANPLGAAITGAQAIFGGIGEVVRDRREAKAAGEKYSFGEGLKDFGAGALKGVTGIDLTDQQATPEPVEYTTNINPMTGQEIPLTMKQKPIKALTQMQGTVAHNMSAKQYNKALQMKEISGAATMMTRDEKIAQINAIPGMPENVKEKMRSAATVVGDVKKYSTIDEAPKPPAYSAKKQKLKPISELSKFEKAKIFNKYAMETGLSPNFDSIRQAAGYEAESDAMKKFYSDPANVRMMNKEQKKYFNK